MRFNLSESGLMVRAKTDHPTGGSINQMTLLKVLKLELQLYVVIIAEDVP